MYRCLGRWNLDPRAHARAGTRGRRGNLIPGRQRPVRNLLRDTDADREDDNLRAPRRSAGRELAIDLDQHRWRMPRIS
jgi:hypothetical protein